ncbi:unnamed protein product [Caenorhabditis sp. 36 PRJEB53466]|nr:unnamed protein product [Caenorhabditis sp. 36 PRJEB53466]
MDSDDNENISEDNQNSLDEEVSGLRSKRLLAMVVCLLILFLLTFLLLILNILIITTLRMDPTGIKFLRFHHNVNVQNGQIEKTVEMAGDKIQFEKVVTNKVVGFPSKDILIHAPRMLISSRPNDSILVISEKLCKLERINNFQVLSPNGRTLFSARHPTVSIDKRIKKLAAEKIITNKCFVGTNKSE